MSLSPQVAEWAAAYEQEHGKKPPEPVMEIILHIDNVGAMLRKQGRKDAQSDQEPRHAGTFVELAQYAFHYGLDEEIAQVIGGLWQDEYMDGYQIE